MLDGWEGVLSGGEPATLRVFGRRVVCGWTNGWGVDDGAEVVGVVVVHQQCGAKVPKTESSIAGKHLWGLCGINTVYKGGAPSAITHSNDTESKVPQRYAGCRRSVETGTVASDALVDRWPSAMWSEATFRIQRDCWDRHCEAEPGWRRPMELWATNEMNRGELETALAASGDAADCSDRLLVRETEMSNVDSQTDTGLRRQPLNSSVAARILCFLVLLMGLSWLPSTAAMAQDYVHRKAFFHLGETLYYTHNFISQTAYVELINLPGKGVGYWGYDSNFYILKDRRLAARVRDIPGAIGLGQPSQYVSFYRNGVSTTRSGSTFEKRDGFGNLVKTISCAPVDGGVIWGDEMPDEKYLLLGEKGIAIYSRFGTFLRMLAALFHFVWKRDLNLATLLGRRACALGA